MHARAAQLVVERLAEPQHVRLGRRVRGIGRRRLIRADRSHLEYAPPPPAQHVRNVQLRQLRERDDVELQQLQFALPRNLHVRAVDAEAGVVDEQIDGEPRVAGAPMQLRRGIGSPEVQRLHVYGDAVRGPQRVGELLQPVLAARHEHQVRAVLGEHARELLADPARSAGHQRGGALPGRHRNGRHRSSSCAGAGWNKRQTDSSACSMAWSSSRT